MLYTDAPKKQPLVAVCACAEFWACNREVTHGGYCTRTHPSLRLRLMGTNGEE